MLFNLLATIISCPVLRNAHEILLNQTKSVIKKFKKCLAIVQKDTTPVLHVEMRVSVISMTQLGNRTNKVCCEKNSKCRRLEERPKRKMMYVLVIFYFSYLAALFLT